MTAIDRLSIIWKSDLLEKIKTGFLPSNGCVSTILQMLTKQIDKKVDLKYTRELHVVLNKSCK